MSELALKTTSDPEVKAFAKMMIDDHTRHRKEMIADGQGDEGRHAGGRGEGRRGRPGAAEQADRARRSTPPTSR